MPVILTAFVLALQAASPQPSSISSAVFPNPVPVFTTPEGKVVRGKLEVLTQAAISADERIVVVAASEPSQSVYDPDRGYEVRLARVRREKGWVLSWSRDLSAEIPVRLGEPNDRPAQCASVTATLKRLPGSDLFLLALESRLSGQGRVSQADLTLRTLGGESPGREILKVPKFSEHGRVGMRYSYQKGAEVRFRGETAESAAVLHLTTIEQTRTEFELRPPHRSFSAFVQRDGHWVEANSSDRPSLRPPVQKPVLALGVLTEPTGTAATNAECEALRSLVEDVTNEITNATIDDRRAATIARLSRRLRAPSTPPPCGQLETREIRKALVSWRKKREVDATALRQLESELRQIDRELSTLEGLPAAEIRVADRAETHEQAVQILQRLVRQFPWDPAAAVALCEGRVGREALQGVPSPHLFRAMVAGCHTAVARLQPLFFHAYEDIKRSLVGGFARLGCATSLPEPPEWSATVQQTKDWLGSFVCPSTPINGAPAR